VLSNTNKEPDANDSNVNELILKRYSFVKKISNCWGKYKLMNTIIEIYCTSSIILMRKCLCPVRRPLIIVKSNANPINAAITDLLL